MTGTLLLASVAFVLFGFFAGSEMAYLSCNKLRLRHLADEGDRRAQIILRFHRDPKRFLTTILIGTNLMHVTVTGLITFLWATRFPFLSEWLVVPILSLLIIIFAETIPKYWFRHRADDFIYRFAFTLNLLDRLLGGCSKLVMALTDLLLRASAPGAKRSPYVTREEFRYVIEESTKGGVLLAHEKQLIDTILNLGSVRVEELMIPVAKFPKVSLTEPVSRVKEIARLTTSQVVLVYEEIPTLIVGLVYVFDVLFEKDETGSLAGFLKAPFFIDHDVTAEKAILLLQSKHASYGIVIHVNGEVVGVVSLENLIQF